MLKFVSADLDTSYFYERTDDLREFLFPKLIVTFNVDNVQKFSPFWSTPNFNSQEFLEFMFAECDLILPKPVKVIFNFPMTIVIFDDGTKTMICCDENTIFDKEKAVLLAIIKRLYKKEAFDIFDKFVYNKDIEVFKENEMINHNLNLAVHDIFGIAGDDNDSLDS